MPQPKRLHLVGVKLTDDELAVLIEETVRGTKARRTYDPTAPEKTKSEVLRECFTVVVTTRKSLRLGFDVIRQIPELMQSETSLTVVHQV